MKRTVLITILTSGLFFSNPLLSGPLVNLTVHQSLADKFVRIPVNETMPVNHTTVDGINVQGTASVQGLVRGKFNPEQDGAGLLLKMETRTFTSSRQSTWPRPNIYISFDWDITTDTTTYKRLALLTGGVADGAAAAYSKSYIQYGDINAQANGLFPRITASIARHAAQREIYGRHNQSVADANQSVGSRLAAALDLRVTDMLVSAKELFARFIEGPLVKRRLLGGEVAFGGDEDIAQVRVEDSKPVQGMVVDPLSVSEAEPLAIQIQPKALETFLSKTFGGAEFTEIEVIEMLFDRTMPIKSAEDIHQKNEELLVHFDTVKPFGFSFKDDQLIVTIRSQRVETLGRSWKDLDFNRLLKIRRDQGKIFLSFMAPWTVSDRSGTAVDPVFQKHMISRLDEILPQGEVNLVGLDLSRNLPVKIELSALEARDNSLIARLTAELKTQANGQTVATGPHGRTF